MKSKLKNRSYRSPKAFFREKIFSSDLRFYQIFNFIRDSLYYLFLHICAFLLYILFLLKAIEEYILIVVKIIIKVNPKICNSIKNILCYVNAKVIKKILGFLKEIFIKITPIFTRFFNHNKAFHTIEKFFKSILILKLFKLCKLNLSKYHNSFFISFLLHVFILGVFFVGGYQFYHHHQDKKTNFVVIDDIKIAKIANYQTERISEDNSNYSDSKSNILEQHTISQNISKENSMIVEGTKNKKQHRPNRSPNVDLKKAQLNTNRNINIPSRKPMNSNEKKLSSILLSIEDRKKYTLDKGEEQKGLLGRSENKNIKDDNTHITASIIDSIKGQFSACWTLPAGVTNGKNMTVVLFLELDKKGNVLKVNHKHKFKYNREPLYRAFVDSAIRAVYRCSPIMGLEKIPYSEWSNIEMIFDPELMF